LRIRNDVLLNHGTVKGVGIVADKELTGEVGWVAVFVCVCVFFTVLNVFYGTFDGGMNSYVI
jgi:hypothetical protein